MIFKSQSWKSLTNLSEYTKLLIHSNSTDGSTTFTDSSASGHTVTPEGTAAHDTAQYKFSPTAILFEGDGLNYLSIADHNDFYLSGSFTIDFWARWGTVGNSIFIEQYAASGDSWYFQYVSDNLNFYVRNGASDELLSASWTPSDSVWYHISVLKASADLLFFVNGILIDTKTPSLEIANSAHAIKIGRNGTGGNMWLDEFRLVNGKAMWTTEFVPPKGRYS
jgi:hypothetical protein